MRTINKLNELSEILLSKKTAIISENLLQEIEKFKNTSNFYIYPINELINISFIISITDNMILNKTYYQNIKGVWKIHNEKDSSIINYNTDGTIDSESWYIEGKNLNLDYYKPLKVFYSYNKNGLSIISFYYEPCKMNFGFKHINYDVINKEISEILFILNGKPLLKEKFINHSDLKNISTFVINSDYYDFYTFDKIKDELEIIKLINY